MMLDIGTRAERHSIYKLYKYMKKHKHCGGCCGEIEVDFPGGDGLGNTLIKVAQFYEYKMGHTPDKACESLYGYNSVLPGAYSLFRWEAVQGKPLQEFYRGNNKESLSCAEANKFLAEDRIMCLEIIIKERTGYYLTYVPEARSYTDAPPMLATLIS